MDSLHVRGVDMLDDHVVVYLEVEYGVVDDVVVLPQEHRSLAIVNGSIELTLLYNTVYDVNVQASCGDSRLYSNTKLDYGEKDGRRRGREGEGGKESGR